MVDVAPKTSRGAWPTPDKLSGLARKFLIPCVNPGSPNRRAAGGRQGGYASTTVLPVAHLERREEGRLRDLDLAELAHALAPLLLLVEELALARDIAAVALGEDVLAEGLHRLAGDDAAADRGLDCDLEELARNEALQALAQRP